MMRVPVAVPFCVLGMGILLFSLVDMGDGNTDKSVVRADQFESFDQPQNLPTAAQVKRLS